MTMWTMVRVWFEFKIYFYKILVNSKINPNKTLIDPIIKQKTKT